MQPGDVIGGRYRLDLPVGRGGAGTVFRATDRQGGQVAVKVVEAEDPVDAARFQREAGFLAALDHPAIVRYVDHGTMGPWLYLVMEWLAGETLGERLETTGVSPRECLEIGTQAAAGLAYAHAAGVVHRDVKPDNLILAGGRLRIVDLGIARAILAAPNTSLTVTGTVVGTPGYMAPEQARGERSLDGKADVFALGCVLYECLAGRPAFSGTTHAATLLKILVGEPLPLAVGGPLAALAMRMLTKDHAARPEMAEVARDLAGLDAPEGPRARSASPGETVRAPGCLVLVAPPPGMALERALDAVRGLVPPGARVTVHETRDARLLAWVRGSGGLPAQAELGGSIALGAVTALPGAAVAVSAALSADPADSVTALVDAALLESAFGLPAAGVRTDAETAELLAARFAVTPSGAYFRLSR